MIKITAKRDGFRRGGIAHPPAPTEYPNDRFTALELKQLQAEPMLVVEIVADPKPSGKGKEKEKEAASVADDGKDEDKTVPAESGAAAEEDKGAK